MDVVKFVAVNSFLEDYLVVDILINGYRLIDLLQLLESRFAKVEGRKSLAGAYEGLPPLMVLPPQKIFFGGCYRRLYFRRRPDRLAGICLFRRSGRLDPGC